MIKSLEDIFKKNVVRFSAEIKMSAYDPKYRREKVYRNAIDYFFSEAIPESRQDAQISCLATWLSAIRYYGEDFRSDFYLYTRFAGPALYLVNKKNNQVFDYVGISNLTGMRKKLWPQRGKLLTVLGPVFRPPFQIAWSTPLIIEAKNKILKFPLMPGLANLKPNSIRLIEDK
jgi:hypothetical protein